MRSPYDPVSTVERRRTQLRTILFLIILGTLPFYLLGMVLWIQSSNEVAIETPIARPTNTVIGEGIPTTQIPTLRPTNTPLPTLPGQVRQTPPQFNPPTRIIPTVFIPTVFIPSSTPAPTLTPFPTVTPFPTAAPPTFTPLPPPTDTPFIPPVPPTITQGAPPIPPPGSEATPPVGTP